LWQHNNNLIAKNKKINLFIFFGLLFLLSSGFCLAGGLEIAYPKLPTGNVLSADTTSIPIYFKYLFDAGTIAGFFAVFVSLVWSGVLFMISTTVDMRSDAKDRLSGAISGLIILILLYLIVTTINPALSIFKMGTLTPTPPPPTQPPSPGVYFYQTTDCSQDVGLHTESVGDFGDYKNKVSSAKIIHDIQNGNSFISIIFGNIDLKGKCLYLDPNDSSCQKIGDSPFTNSAAIYKFDPSSNGNGVTFYREPNFNEDGGNYFVSNKDISNTKKIYMLSLSETKFTDSKGKCAVPEEKQDCLKPDPKSVENDPSKCLQRECPSLGGQNINSIKIDGNYIVMFVYYSKEDPSKGPWSYCQIFPTSDDKEKQGPISFKWADIMNNNKGFLPNYVLIIPVKNK
jgi:hypothetical protein